MPLFAFLDESGDYDFHTRSAKFLVFTGIVTPNPILFNSELTRLKYDLHVKNHCLQRFHACADKQDVRAQVFDIVSGSNDFEIHSIIVRKNRVNPSLYKYGVYSVAYRTLLKYFSGASQRGAKRKIDSLHLIVDTVPDKKQQVSMQNNLTQTAHTVLSNRAIPYTINHHTSYAHCLLQVADYCAWAIQKKWNAADERSYNRIKLRIVNEFDIYRSGDQDYY